VTSNAFLKLRQQPGSGPASGAAAQSTRVQDNLNATLQPISTAVNGTPMTGTAPVWIALNLGPLWANFGSGGAVASYYVDSFMRVWVKGRIVTAAGAAIGALVLTMPANARTSDAQTVNLPSDTYQAADISPSGRITMRTLAGAGAIVDLSFTYLAGG